MGKEAVAEANSYRGGGWMDGCEEGTALDEPWGRGCEVCAAARLSQSDNASQRNDANLKRKDCCDFGSGAENGEEELKNMN